MNSIQNKYRNERVKVAYDCLVQSVKKLGEQYHSSLAELAQRYKEQIKKDPSLQEDFFSMCYAIGVDPLSSTKGFWQEIFGFGDFYKTLTISIINICIKTQPENGGLIPLTDLIYYLKSTMNVDSISANDIKRSLLQIQKLSPEYSIIELDGKEMLLNKPQQFSDYQRIILSYLSDTSKPTVNRFITLTIATNICRIPRQHVSKILDDMMQDCFLWIDNQCEGEARYYCPSFNITSNLM